LINATMNLDTSAASYYTTLEVAKMLGMAVRSVQLMVDRGDLQAWKTPGGHRRITRDSLERWMQGSRSSGMRGAPGLRSSEAGESRSATRRRLGTQGPRVLLIEDSSHFQNLVSLLVKQKFPDVELHIASDGITGLVSFGQLQPDLIIVDILLPGIDGASLITGLRRHALFGNCQLIVLTSLDEAQRGPYAFALEDVAVIHKPRLMTELYQRMADVLQGPQAVETAPARAADPEAD
jgi:excisionase family DNA binding protein